MPMEEDVDDDDDTESHIVCVCREKRERFCPPIRKDKILHFSFEFPAGSQKRAVRDGLASWYRYGT